MSSHLLDGIEEEKSKDMGKGHLQLESAVGPA